MKQLTQKLRDGEMRVLDVPMPVTAPGTVLVRVHYSLISAGTEGSTVSAARKNLLAKAKERPEQVRQVINTLKQQGLLQTYRAVEKRLNSYSPLGYSAAGEVIGVHPAVKSFSVGDLVACGGAGYANHAEVVAVPENLCVKLARSADLSKAAYNTVGAIALQGVRQADLRLGECCVVVGLGLLGQLTCMLLRASGVKVVGTDVDVRTVKMASQHCVDLALTMGGRGCAEQIDEFTGGAGADAVIVTAATSSLEPINFAGRVLRKRGTVVVVGSVPTGFDREPHYYRKELTLKMSCSYGPGRYDIAYEEKGIDYPYAYVRWTEKRNMQAFQELLHTGALDIGYLTTHCYKFEDSPAAYDVILKREELVLGALLQYDVSKPIRTEKLQVGKDRAVSVDKEQLGIAFVGAGSYAMSHLLPNIPRQDRIVLTGVMTSSGTSSRTVAEKYGFQFCTSSEHDILTGDDSDVVFVATRHDSHAYYVRCALQSGKHVFVEKPLCLSLEELRGISAIYDTATREKGPRLLMVGFNRRFSPLAELMKKEVGRGPMSMLYRINAGAIPTDSWIQDSEIGGGRIVGEVCHFVDFLIYMCDSNPERVFASAMADADNLQDTVNVTLQFENGSVGTISYFSNGSKELAKEYIEVYRAGATAILSDFRELQVFTRGKRLKTRLLSQDKGQKVMVETFLDALLQGKSNPIPWPQTHAATLTTFAILESLRTNQAITLTGFGE